MTDPYPFRTRPYLRTKVWGGRKIPEQFGKQTDDDGPIGEAWEVSDLQEGQSYIENGPMAGRPLSEIVDAWGSDLVGTESPLEAFPLLVKLLDADDDLSVQVHPSEEDVRTTFPEADSKDECWVILGVEEGGSILHGFKEGVTAEEFRRAVDDDRAAELLRRVEVEPGQIVRVVPGTIHAICTGVSLLEIQQPSDTTYRVYDYNRPGLDGQPRELHLDEAMQVANFDDQPPTSLDGESLAFEGGRLDLLVDVPPSYRIERLRADKPVGWSVDPASCQVLFALEGGFELGAPNLQEPLLIGESQTAIVPAVSERVEIRPTDGPVEIIVSGVGGVPLVGG